MQIKGNVLFMFSNHGELEGILFTFFFVLKLFFILKKNTREQEKFRKQIIFYFKKKHIKYYIKAKNTKNYLQKQEPKEIGI